VSERASTKKASTTTLMTITVRIDNISFDDLVDFRAKIVFLHNIANYAE
jgi:hypothetical protein